LWLGSKRKKEGIGIAASDVVEVKGEDPVTPDCLREDRVRRYVDYKSLNPNFAAKSWSSKNSKIVPKISPPAARGWELKGQERKKIFELHAQ